MILGKNITLAPIVPPLLVILHNTTTPTPYLSTTLGDSFTTGTAISTMGGTSPRFIKIAANDKTKMVCIRNSATADDVAFYSTNGGSTWSSYSTQNSYMWGTAISDNGAAMFTLRAHVTEALYHTYNTGSSWTTVGSLSDTIKGIAVNSDASIVYLCSGTLTTGKKSINSCSSFSSYTQPWYGHSMDMANDDSRVFLGSFNATSVIVAYSTNGGTNWTQVTLESGGSGWNTDVKCSRNGKYVFASRSLKAWVSNDYGNSGTYTQVLSSYSDFHSASLSVSCSGKYMAIGSDTVNGRFYISSDYGVTWTQKNTGVASVVTALAIQE